MLNRHKPKARKWIYLRSQARVAAPLLIPLLLSPALEAQARGGDRRAPRREYRTIDGTLNNRRDVMMGSAGDVLSRWVAPDYADGKGAMAGPDRMSARVVSNAFAAPPDREANRGGASDFLWQWGQFLDHDLDLTEVGEPLEPAPILVPLGDPAFDPFGTGLQYIAFHRSRYRLVPPGTRRHVNDITSWIDASNVYGSDPVRARALRTLDGTGRLKTSPGNFLPWNREGLPNAGGSGPDLFLAGDVRANEQVGLTTLHTLFVREHNRVARLLARRHPGWSGDALYEEARRWVGAEMQVITYREFLPALLGHGALEPYRGYNRRADGRISTLFSTAAYRFGHSALSAQLLRLRRSGRPIRHGHLPLREAFFAPDRLLYEGGIEPILRGLAFQRCEAIDPFLVDDVRNFLFGPPGAGGFDLASLNIQRGRDHGLPAYNDVREAMGFRRARSWADLSADRAIQRRLASVYDTVDDVDVWVGGLAEAPLRRSHLGPLFHRIVAEQFEALRDADRFWYERSFSRAEIRQLERLTLSTLIRLNTRIGSELQRNVFRARGR